MPAREKVSVQDIVNALIKWRGDQTQAARDCGIHRNALIRRCRSNRIDMNAFRSIGSKVGNMVHTFNSGDTVHPFANHAHDQAVRSVNSRAHVAEANPRGRVPAVSSAPASLLAAAAEGRSGRLRIAPAHMDLLTQAKYDLQAKLRRDLDEGQVLEMCLEDVLRSWIAGALSHAPGAEPTTEERPARRGRDKDKR